MKKYVDDILAAAGAISISAGVFLINVSAGLIVMGLCLIAAAAICYSGGDGG